MTTTEEATVAGELLKMDVLGRVKVKAGYREAMLDAYEASGMSGQAFAIHHGIKVQTFGCFPTGNPRVVIRSSALRLPPSQ